MMTATTTQIDLSHHTGGGDQYSMGPLFRRLAITEGVRDLCEQAGCYWLADLIGSHQRRIAARHGLQEFQVWRVVKLPASAANAARVECWSDTPGASVKLASQLLPYTDFPFDRLPDDFALWLEGDPRTRQTILLPSEH